MPLAVPEILPLDWVDYSTQLQIRRIIQVDLQVALIRGLE